MPRKLTNNDGDMTIQGTLTVLGGINEAQSLKVRTDMESTKQVVEVVQADVVAAQDTADTAVQRTFRYLGPLTSAPGTAGINDFYLDANTLALGGGVLRYYTGSTWEEATIAWPLYMMANWEALADMGEWATVQDEVIVAASAIFTKLTTANAFIGSLFAQQITVPTGGRIQYETGIGVQKRTVRLHDEKIDWLDIPDTSPATAELLRARIARLGVGSSILLDGSFNVNKNPVWGGETVINPEVSDYPTYIQLADGETRVAYAKTINGYLCERVLSGGTWGSESVINSYSCQTPRYFECDDGSVRLAYRKSSDNYLYEKIYTSGAWGTESLISNLSTKRPGYIQEPSGDIRISYIRNSDLYLCEKVNSGGIWGPESVIVNVPISSGPSYIYDNNGSLRIVYGRNSGDFYLVERIRSSGVWGPELTINAASSSDPGYVKTVDGNLRVAYRRNTDGFLVEKINSNGSWGPELAINSAASVHPDYLQTMDGALRVSYRRSASDAYLVERVLQRYYDIGVELDRVNVIATRATAQSIAYNADTTMVFDTESEDSHGAYNPSTGVFTAPYDGLYHFDWSVLMASIQVSVGSYFVARLVHVGVRSYYGNRYEERVSTSSSYKHTNGSATIRMAKGEQAYVSMFQITDGLNARSTYPSGSYNYLTIAKL